MKRILLFALCLLMLVSPVCLAEERYLSLSELREQTPARWTMTYETPWRSVAIDADILVPDGNALPVLLISGGATPPALTAEEAGWDEIEYRGPYDILMSNAIPAYPKGVNGVRVGRPVSKGVWYGRFASENRYVPLDDISFGEIVSRAKEKIVQLGYDPNDFEIDDPVRLWTHHVYGSGTETDLLPGYLYMEARPKVMGIPVMSHIWQAVVSHHGTQRSDEFVLMPNADIGYDGYLGDLSHVYLTPLTIRETLAEDIPLCPFEKVLSAVEKEIEAGHIRKVYELELGYVLYNEPGVYRTGSSEADAYAAYQAARYYAKPAWQVNCLYVESSNGELRDTSSYTDDERNSIDYYQLIIDAQTGELTQQSDAKDRCEYKGFISWDEAR